MKTSYETVPVSPGRIITKNFRKFKRPPPAFPVYHTEDSPKEGGISGVTYTEVFLDHT
jgi:hypothetical protein